MRARRARANGLEFLVEFENTREGDGEVWIAEKHLKDPKAQDAIQKYQNERSRLEKVATKMALKQMRGAAPALITSKTRSGKTK